MYAASIITGTLSVAMLIIIMVVILAIFAGVVCFFSSIFDKHLKI